MFWYQDFVENEIQIIQALEWLIYVVKPREDQEAECWLEKWQTALYAKPSVAASLGSEKHDKAASMPSISAFDVSPWKSKGNTNQFIKL